MFVGSQLVCKIEFCLCFLIVQRRSPSSFSFSLLAVRTRLSHVTPSPPKQLEVFDLFELKKMSLFFRPEKMFEWARGGGDINVSL